MQCRNDCQPTLDKAVSLTHSVELAEKGIKDLQVAATAKLVTTTDNEVFKFNNGTAKKSDNQKADKSKVCYRCGGKHLASLCRFKSEDCHSCGKRGHIAKVCRSRLQTKKAQPQNSSQVHNLSEQLLDSQYDLFVVHTSSGNPLTTTLQVEGHQLTMEIDTGAAVSLVSEETVKNSFMKDLPLHPADVRLRTYTGEVVPVLGKLMVKVEKNEATVTLPLLVIKGGGMTLLGRDWLQNLKLDWKNIFNLNSTVNLQQVLDCHKTVFTDELGTFNKSKVKFYMKEDAKPQFLKARQVPLALRDKVATELDRLEAAGIIAPTKFSHWAAPIVPIVKKDGTI